MLLAGCGGAQPHLSRSDVAPLIALSERIAQEAPCAQARDVRTLRAQAIRLVNTRRVPDALKETLLSGVQGVREPVCLPPAAVEDAPATSPTRQRGGRGHGRGHAYGHGH
jgi:hypothetical protein